jgi:uncharacterized glyoxalase superfamily protein PhnB
MPWLTPSLTVRDAQAALDFYERAFGFQTKFTKDGPDGAIIHAEMTWNDGLVMLSPEGAFGGTTKAPATSGTSSPISLYLYCDDVEALFARAAEAGAGVVTPPMDTFWGDRMCRLTDPDGYSWAFATHVKKAEPAELAATV